MAAPLRRCCCQYFIQQRVLWTSRGRGVCSSPTNLQEAATYNNASESGSSHGVTFRIPKRKKRDELSILKALASTVEQDYNGPHFKFMDDPFLIPASALEKRAYSLAKASGQKAAQFAVENYAAGFMNNVSEPTIKAFNVKLGLQYAEDTEDGLRERLENNQPLAAYQSYQALKQAGTPVADALLDRLLGMLCFYNSMDPPSQLLPEEQFYKRDIGQHNSPANRKSWKDNGAAEQLFAELPEKSASLYIHLLRGRVKYLQVEKAWELYEEMKEKGVSLTVEAYTALISITLFLGDQSETRWRLLQGVLHDMSANGVAPTLALFNMVLYTISRSSKYRVSVTWAMQVINEMKACHIEPSLASWYYVLQTVYNSDDVMSNLLWDIVKDLQGKTLTLTEPVDSEFFSTAMTKCYINLNDLELAYKIDDLLNTGTNVQLIGDGFKEGLYYTYFLRTLCMFEQIDKVMEQYERFTPHAYTPTFAALDDLLKAVDLNEGYSYLPSIWSDMVLFNYTQRTDLVETVLSIMGKKKQDPKLQKSFIQIGQYIKERFEEEKTSRKLRPFMLTGPMVGDLILVSVNGGEMEQAWEYFNVYEENKLNIERFPSEQSLVALIEAALEAKDIDRTLSCLALISDCAYPKVDAMVTKAKDTLDLTGEHINHLDNLL